MTNGPPEPNAEAAPTAIRRDDPVAASSSVRSEDLGLDALAQLVEYSLDGDCLARRAAPWLYINPAGCEVLDCSLEHLIGGSGLLMIPAERQETNRCS